MTAEKVVTMRDVHRVVNVRYECKNGKGRFVKPRGYRLLSLLRWEYEYELIEGYRAPWADQVPMWAQSPIAGIVGTWRGVRRRLTTRRGIPLDSWRELEKR